MYLHGELGPDLVPEVTMPAAPERRTGWSRFASYGVKAGSASVLTACPCASSCSCSTNNGGNDEEPGANAPGSLSVYTSVTVGWIRRSGRRQ